MFEKSIRALRTLNALGYARPGTGLRLDLVYNPVGAVLPPPQAALEAQYRDELARAFGIVFDRLLTITNMPIKRFADTLARDGADARKHWSNASPIRTIFRDAFVRAGLPYFNPHSFRNTLVQLGQEICRTPEQFKAWSQNLGHEKVLTTFLSYGEVACQRQGEIIRKLAKLHETAPTDAEEIAEAVFKKLRGSA